MFSVDVQFDLSQEVILKQCGLQPNGPVQEAFTRLVMQYMEPYWAYDTGRLVNSATPDYSTGEITYNTSYASNMYYGFDDFGRPVNYHLDKHPLAGPYPDVRMWADHGPEIIAEVQRIADNQ